MKFEKDYTINKRFPLSDDQNEIVDFLLKRKHAVNAAQTRTSVRKNVYDLITEQC